MKQCNQQPATTIRNQLFLNHVHNQAGFGKPFINGRIFVYLGISKIVFTLGKLERLIFDYMCIILGSWSQMIKILNLNVSGTKRDVVLKQRPDRFPSTEVTTTFEHTRATQDILL